MSFCQRKLSCISSNSSNNSSIFDTCLSPSSSTSSIASPFQIYINSINSTKSIVSPPLMVRIMDECDVKTKRRRSLIPLELELSSSKYEEFKIDYDHEGDLETFCKSFLGTFDIYSPKPAPAAANLLLLGTPAVQYNSNIEFYTANSTTAMDVDMICEEEISKRSRSDEEEESSSKKFKGDSSIKRLQKGFEDFTEDASSRDRRLNFSEEIVSNDAWAKNDEESSPWDCCEGSSQFESSAIRSGLISGYRSMTEKDDSPFFEKNFSITKIKEEEIEKEWLYEVVSPHLQEVGRIIKSFLYKKDKINQIDLQSIYLEEYAKSLCLKTLEIVHAREKSKIKTTSKVLITRRRYLLSFVISTLSVKFCGGNFNGMHSMFNKAFPQRQFTDYEDNETLLERSLHNSIMRYGSGSEDQDWKIAEIGVLKIVDWKLQFCTISGVINSSGIWKTLSSQEKDFMGKAIIGCYEDQFKLDETGKKLRKTVRMLLSDQDSIRILALACLHATLALENSLESSASCSSPDSQKSSASTIIGVSREEVCTIMDARTNFRLEEGAKSLGLISSNDRNNSSWLPSFCDEFPEAYSQCLQFCLDSIIISAAI